ncbi:hypothetical protein ACIRL3_24230 [Streptomyces sp. NPDC102384]|uniref:hypothetical protein n=1 Tax=Streptomyces sp. NPDC102384 TaxID=3366166 RepID=UPI003823AA7C
MPFRSQISSVLRYPGKKDLYIALVDRWLPDVPAKLCRLVPDLFRRAFAGEEAEPDPALAAVVYDTSVADCVWLPVRFDGDRPVIEWQEEWRIEDYV